MTVATMWLTVMIKSKSDNTYRFVIITEGTSSVFNSETQLAIFNGSEVIDKDGDKTALQLGCKRWRKAIRS